MINDAVRGYFGFERLPFDRSIPVGALFASASHQEAVGRITYGIDTRQITVITGEVGAGKSVAARAAAARLDASRYQLIAIPNPQVGARGIHNAVVTALGGVPRVHHATLIPQAAGHLAAELAERGRLPVLLIDEAHLLSHDQLEAIRMLTSAQLDSASPLAVLLLGQPQLRASMRLGVLAALDQRIAVRYQMAPMTSQETTGYLIHHTRLAPLTELPAGGSRIGGHCLVRLVTFPGHDRTGRLTPGSGRTGRCPHWRAAGDRGPLGALSAG